MHADYINWVVYVYIFSLLRLDIVYCQDYAKETIAGEISSAMISSLCKLSCFHWKLVRFVSNNLELHIYIYIYSIYKISVFIGIKYAHKVPIFLLLYFSYIDFGILSKF